MLECSQNDIDQHADAATDSAPEHQGAAAESFDQPDRWVGGDCKDSVEDSGQDTGESSVVTQVGEYLGAEVDLE
jgi:hypothetical protein